MLLSLSPCICVLHIICSWLTFQLITPGLDRSPGKAPWALTRTSFSRVRLRISATTASFSKGDSEQVEYTNSPPTLVSEAPEISHGQREREASGWINRCFVVSFLSPSPSSCTLVCISPLSAICSCNGCRRIPNSGCHLCHTSGDFRMVPSPLHGTSQITLLVRHTHTLLAYKL